MEIIANSLKDKGIPVFLQIITAPLMFRFRYHLITHSHLYCFFNKFLPGIKNTPAHCVYNRLQKITGRRKSLWRAVIIWTMKARAASSYCLITKERTASKSIRTISKIIIERRLHYVRSISRSLQLLHGLQWLVRLRLGFQLLE